MNYPNAYTGAKECGCVVSLVADITNDKEGTQHRVNNMRNNNLNISYTITEEAMKLLCAITYLNQVIHRCKN
mgnify:CR=1 FL=1